MGLLPSQIPPDLAPYGFPQVAGLHRAVPSAALDKDMKLTHKIITAKFDLSRANAKKLSLQRDDRGLII